MSSRVLWLSGVAVVSVAPLVIGAGPADHEEASDSQRSGVLLESVRTSERLISQQVSVEIEKTLQWARWRVAEDPVSVERELKLSMDRVLRTPQLSAETRNRLRLSLEAMLREAHGRAAVRDSLDVQAQASRSAAANQQRVAAAMTRDHERLRQLMDRFTSLMDENRYAEAERMAQQDVAPLAPETPATTTAAHVARQVGALVANQAQRALRQQAVVQTLAPVELALTPFADDLPVVFPETAVWEELSLRRKGRTKVDLAASSPAEEKIRDALRETASWELVEMPLTDVADYLKDLYGVEIQIDVRALQDAGASEETPVTSRIRAVSLRSALRILLRPMELAYIVRDEAIVITSVDEAARQTVTRARPVADLVVPIVNTPAMSMLGRGNSPSTSVPGGMPGMNLPGNNNLPGGGPALNQF